MGGRSLQPPAAGSPRPSLSLAHPTTHPASPQLVGGSTAANYMLRATPPLHGNGDHPLQCTVCIPYMYTSPYM